MASPLENLTGPGKPLHKDPPDAPANRYIVFQVLPHTLGLGPEVWRVLDKCHSVRNLGEYEGDLNIDGRLVADLIAASRSVAELKDVVAEAKGTGAMAIKIDADLPVPLVKAITIEAHRRAPGEQGGHDARRCMPVLGGSSSADRSRPIAP